VINMKTAKAFGLNGRYCSSTVCEGAQMDISHRTVTTNGIKMHIAKAETGPLVVMCHGFPES